ncbi:MAG: 6-pyruvoyl tetrahydropterin synthase family protein [Candidatus Thermoplasmatota archaeon]|nr:6-pyruvoyl tetrahydropterin synthase family protein [Candidatus Thermoplasmatota archaeon]
MDGWKSNIRFSSAHIIPEYEKCGRLHGHTYAVHAKINGDPDKNGIIMDFSLLKNSLKQIVDELDHKILIPKKSINVKIEKDKKNVKISFFEKNYVFPLSDCVFLPITSTSAENLGLYILKKVLDKIVFMKNIKSIEIGVDEGYGQGARILKKL